jgi:hypothetical protein
MIETFGRVCGCGSLVLNLKKQIKCELFICYTFFALYYTWMLRINEKMMVVSNMFQWLKELL